MWPSLPVCSGPSEGRADLAFGPACHWGGGDAAQTCGGWPAGGGSTAWGHTGRATVSKVIIQLLGLLLQQNGVQLWVVGNLRKTENIVS